MKATLGFSRTKMKEMLILEYQMAMRTMLPEYASELMERWDGFHGKRHLISPLTEWFNHDRTLCHCGKYRFIESFAAILQP